MSGKPTIILAVVILTWASSARAQANDRSSPLGGRSALMGNTGVALGRDGAAPFTNPATIVGINDRKIAFSVNFLALEVNRFDHFHQPGPVDPRFGNVALDQRSVSSARFNSIPSTICVFISRSSLKGEKTPVEGDPTPWEGGHQKFAICLASLEAQELLVPALSLHSPTSAGVTAQDASLSRKWNRVQFGPSYSAQVNEELALGLSLQGAYTSYSFVQDAASITSATDGTAVQSSLGAAGNGSSFDLTAILGATYEFPGATIGASVQIPSLHLTGSYAATLHQTLDTMTGSQATVASGTGTFRAKPPVRIAVGIGKALPRLTVEADVSFDFGYAQGLASSMQIDSATVTDGAIASSTFNATYAARTLPKFNASVGGEYFMTPRLSALGGIWTNVSAFGPLQPEPAPSLGNLVQARAHRVGLSLGLGSYRDGGELLLGTQLGYSWGQAIVPNLYAVPSDWSVVSSSSFSALFIIAGSTNLRAIKGAIEGVTKALTPGAVETPKTPAESK